MGVTTRLWCRAKFTVGRGILQLGWKGASLAWFESALSTSPDNVYARHLRAFALAETGKYDEALVEYRGVVDQTPDDPVALGGLASSLQALGRHEEAIPVLYAAIDRDHRSPFLLSCLGDSLVACDKLQDALLVYRRLVNIIPEDHAAIGNMGATLAKLGHWAEALECHEQALALNPHAAHAFNQAWALMELRRRSDAERASRHAVALDPKSGETLALLAGILAWQDRNAEALPLAEEARRREPENLLVLITWSTVLANVNRLDEARSVGEELVRRSPGEPISHCVLGWALLRTGQAEAAVRCYDRALELAPADHGVQGGRAAALSGAGRHAEAVVAFEAVLAEDPDFLEFSDDFAPYFAASRAAVRQRIEDRTNE